MKEKIMMSHEKDMMQYLDAPSADKQSGAVEACWAHNPEVSGSKPRSAIYDYYFSFFQFKNRSREVNLFLRATFRNTSYSFEREQWFFPNETFLELRASSYSYQAGVLEVESSP